MAVIVLLRGFLGVHLTLTSMQLLLGAVYCSDVSAVKVCAQKHLNSVWENWLKNYFEPVNTLLNYNPNHQSMSHFYNI